MTVDAYTGSIETTRRVIRRPDGTQLDPRLDLEEAALAILADCTGDDALALKLCKAFKLGVISRLPVDQGWALTVDEVRRWVVRHEPMANTAVPWARRDVSGDGAVDIH